MPEPDQHEIPFEERRYRNQKLRRRGIFLIPSLFTVANLLCGYYAVVAALIGGADNFDRGAKAIGFAILFDSLDGRLARAVMSIQAVKAVEIGSGIANAASYGSEVQDEIRYDAGRMRFARSSNRAGGLEGGMTNGEDVVVRGYMKPISTLRRPLLSADLRTKEAVRAAYERADVCVVPAGGVAGEAMTALVLAEAALEKFGGDSLEETRRNFENYQRQLDSF